MKNVKGISTLLVMAALLTFFCSIENVKAEDQKDYKGWGINDPYNKFYNAKELDSFKGRVKKFKTLTPLPGMACPCNW